MKYIIGHKNPDTDTICSAIGYQAFLEARNIKSEAKIRNNIWSFLLFSAEFKLENVGDWKVEVKTNAENQKGATRGAVINAGPVNMSLV